MTYEGKFTVAVEPGVGIGPVRLGMGLPEVVEALGEPEGRLPETTSGGGGTAVTRETLYWHAAAFQVCSGGDGSVASIMVCRGAPIPMLREMDLLRTPADEVVARLEDLGDGRYEEDGFSFSFPQARLGFWRQGHPDDEWEPGEYEQYREGRFWDTVSVWAEEQDAGEQGRADLSPNP